MTDVRIVTGERREDAFAVRRTVFVEEQGVDPDIEYDGHDEDAVHFVAYEDGQPVGAARLRRLDIDAGKVERVAVLEPYRGTGIGKALMEAVERRARTIGYRELKIHAQRRVADFYRALGYDQRGETFEEAGIPHVRMGKTLE